MNHHPTHELIAHLRGELGADEAAAVARHLEGCPQCRRERDGFQTLLASLSRTAPPPPELDWGRWGAELRARLEAGGGRAGWLAGRRPAWVGLTLGLGLLAAGLTVPLGLGPGRAPEPPEPIAMDETLVGRRLDLLRDYRLIERLELLEDIEIISQLDRLAAQDG